MTESMQDRPFKFYINDTIFYTLNSLLKNLQILYPQFLVDCCLIPISHILDDSFHQVNIGSFNIDNSLFFV